MKINNNMLAGGLFIALLLVIGGTWVSLNYINTLTGAATTGIGTTNLTVTTVISCTVDDNQIDLGTLTRGATTEGDQNESDLIAISNDGNANITVIVNASETVYLWSSDPPASSNWQIKCAASADGNSTCNTTYTNVPAYSSNHTLIVGLSAQDEFDNFSVDVKVIVPNDEPSGPKNGSLAFWCYENSIGGA